MKKFIRRICLTTSNKMGKQKIPLHQNSCKILLKIVDLETKIDITNNNINMDTLG